MSLGIVRQPCLRQQVVFGTASCCHLYADPQRRHESSFRRTTKRLRVKPDASFLPSSTSPQQDHIVFNPPSSAPSVYHTPLTFLPRTDRRRSLFPARRPEPFSASTSSSTASPPPSSTPSASHLPPAVRQPYEKKYHLGPKEIAEIRRLRHNQPHIYTSHVLAKRFDCSPLFVSIICQASRQQREREEAKLEMVKSRWGRKRRTAREDRTRRQETWGREEV